FEFDGKLNPTFVEGEFKLPLSSTRAYLKEPITPRGRSGFCEQEGLLIIHYEISSSLFRRISRRED
ncbi:unnamed protein product, partial [Prunus brigantina]